MIPFQNSNAFWIILFNFPLQIDRYSFQCIFKSVFWSGNWAANHFGGMWLTCRPTLLPGPSLRWDKALEQKPFLAQSALQFCWFYTSFRHQPTASYLKYINCRPDKWSEASSSESFHSPNILSLNQKMSARAIWTIKKQRMSFYNSLTPSVQNGPFQALHSSSSCSICSLQGTALPPMPYSGPPKRNMISKRINAQYFQGHPKLKSNPQSQPWSESTHPIKQHHTAL